MRIRLAAALLVAATPLLAAAFHADPEEAAIRSAIDHYFQGHATGDGNHFRQVFHPQSNLYAIREGKYWQLTSADYAARATGQPPADEAKRKRSITSIDRTGNAAVVKLVLDYPSVKFTDYMSMLKVDGQWKIVAKMFEAEARS